MKIKSRLLNLSIYQKVYEIGVSYPRKKVRKKRLKDVQKGGKEDRPIICLLKTVKINKNVY